MSIEQLTIYIRFLIRLHPLIQHSPTDRQSQLASQEMDKDPVHPSRNLSICRSLCAENAFSRNLISLIKDAKGPRPQMDSRTDGRTLREWWKVLHADTLSVCVCATLAAFRTQFTWILYYVMHELVGANVFLRKVVVACHLLTPMRRRWKGGAVGEGGRKGPGIKYQRNIGGLTRFSLQAFPFDRGQSSFCILKEIAFPYKERKREFTCVVIRSRRRSVCLWF